MQSIESLQTLIHIPNWICWKKVQKTTKKGVKKIIKLPVNPMTGMAASSTNPAHWATYEVAKAALNRYNVDGLGFVFTKEAGIVGVDFDNVIDENGVLSTRVRQAVDLLDSYTELSPSGNGLHVLVKGLIPKSLKTEEIEIYDTGRYFTITGEHLEGTPLKVNTRQAELIEIMATHQPPTIEEIREALSHIPADTDYNSSWLKILMAVHSVYPNKTGVNLIEEWSPGFPNEVENKFNSFKSGGGITIATLFYIAKEHGFDRKQVLLDTVYPPLDDIQRVQVSVIIEKMANERLWEKHNAMLMDEHLDRLQLPRSIADHHMIGFVEKWINQDSGEIANGLISIPFFDTFGDALDIQYVEENGKKVGGVSDTPSVYYVSPSRPLAPKVAIITPDSLSAIHASMNHEGMKLNGDKDVSFWGWGENGELDTSMLDNYELVYVISDRSTDDSQFTKLKGKAKIVKFPLNVQRAVTHLSTRELSRILVSARKMG